MRAAIGALVNLDGALAQRLELELLAARARLPERGAPRLACSLEAGLVWVPVRRGAGGSSSGNLDVAAAAGGGSGVAGDHLCFDVVLDGTLDNRAELARELGAPPEAASPAGEPRLLAAAYERWGADCPARLIGDFAFVLWDRRERRLFAARDPFGLRELFYAVDGRQVRIASQLQMLLERPALSELDEEYAADFLASPGACGPATPFKSVRRLRAGHRLTVSAGRVATSRWWSPTERRWPREWRQDDAVEHFRALLEAAVARCLATGGRAWAELSGGLDSSSIVCLAQEILRREPARARDFATLSYVWRDSPQCDERRWSEQVVDKYRLVNHRVWCDGLFFDGIAEECRYRNEPHFGLLAYPMLRAVSQLLRAFGVEVLLSGARAEAVVLADQMAPVQLADTLRRLRLGELGDQLVRWHRGTQLPLANLLLAFAVRPLFGRRRFLHSLYDKRGVHPWVNKQFAARMEIKQRIRQARADRRFSGIAQQQHYELLVRTEQGLARGSLEWSCEIRHPFLDQPLVELALATPREQQVAPREGKLLLRRALAGRLPEEVRTRRPGGGPGADLYKSFAKRWHAIEPVVRSSLLVSMGLVDRVELSRAAELARFGAAESFTDFLSCLAFEYWLRSVVGEEPETRTMPLRQMRASG